MISINKVFSRNPSWLLIARTNLISWAQLVFGLVGMSYYVIFCLCLVQLVWVSLVMFCSVGLSWFVLFCLRLVDLQSVSHLFFVGWPIHLSCIFLVSFELQLMCHGWHGCGGTWFVLIWFRFSEVVPELVLYPVMSHFLLLNGHSQQPMRQNALFGLGWRVWHIHTHLFTSVLMPHWYTTARDSGGQVD